MLILRRELSNLVACEVRELPLTLQSIMRNGRACMSVSFYIVRRVQCQVTTATGACGYLL